MTNQLDIARLFSSGKFDQGADWLSQDVSFHIYEDKKHLIGKPAVLGFYEGIIEYFNSVDTDFQETGHLVSQSKVVIYGYGEFKRAGELLNAVHSCDIYEFNMEGLIVQIHSYCNSNQR